MLKLFKSPFSLLTFIMALGAVPTFAQNTVNTSSVPIPGGTTGTGSVLIGPGNTYSGSFSGIDVVAIGRGAGRSNQVGSWSVFVGSDAGRNHTNGGYNVFIGNSAGYSTTTGSSNSFLGSSAGYNNTTGKHNVFMGNGVGFANITGDQNAFVGSGAGSGNTTGENNVFIGYQAGFKNTDGESNSFIGSYAGYSNTSGQNNSFVGFQAGNQNSTGNSNSFFGHQSGYYNTGGKNNSFVGYQAGYKNNDGFSNAFVGYLAGSANLNGSRNTFLGSNAGQSNYNGERNTIIGFYAGSVNTSGSSNTFVGEGAGDNNISGSSNTYIGTAAKGISSVLQRATAIGYLAKVGVDDGLVLGDTVDVKVGIGTAYPNQRLTIRGDMNFVAYDNSLRLQNQPFLHFNEHESLALGLGAEIAPGASRMLVLGSDESTVQIPGILNVYQPNTSQFLTVDAKGNMILTQSRVQVASVADWSDKVFAPNYALRSLGEVEEFVKKNRHLPGVPSAETMVAEGMESAAFNAKLLEKIEELTLYVVELEKKNETQQKEIEKLADTNAEVKLLREEMAELKALMRRDK